jgi:hypothetical protein
MAEGQGTTQGISQYLQRQQRSVAIRRDRYCECVKDYVSDPDCPNCHGSGVRPIEPLSDEAKAFDAEPIPPGHPGLEQESYNLTGWCGEWPVRR